MPVGNSLILRPETVILTQPATTLNCRWWDAFSQKSKVVAAVGAEIRTFVCSKLQVGQVHAHRIVTAYDLNYICTLNGCKDNCIY